MITWKTDQQARPLGPGQKGTYVVLFVSDEMEERKAFEERFAKLELPRRMPRVVVDVGGAKETARWFGIRKTPALAVIHDGALLSIEYQCEEGVCGRLIGFATQQLSSLEAGCYAPWGRVSKLGLDGAA